MAIASNSFKLKLTLMSVILSGCVVVALACTFLTVLNRIGLSRVDQEITALGESQLRGQPRPEHWRKLSTSLRYIYGDDYETKIVFKVMTQEGMLHHQSENWDSEIFDDQLAMPIQTGVSESRNDDVEFDDFERLHGRHPEERHFGGPRRPGRPHDRRQAGPKGHPRQPPSPLAQPTFKTIESADAHWRVGVFDTDRTVLAIGINLKEVFAEKHHFQLVFFVATPLALMLLGVAGWLLACRALKPVNLIAKTADAISAIDLSRRIPTVRSDREFTMLIETINGMLARLERSFHQAARFSADAAHELKTPLTILQGQLDQAIQDADDGSEPQQVYSELLEEVLRLKSIVAKLLLLARADSGQLRIRDGHPVSLTEAVQLCFEDLHLQAEGISLKANIDPDVWIQADEVLITQILVNLFSNAIKYNHTDGQLEVALTSREGKAELRVRNTGNPIPPTDTERIFERFYRVDEAHARTCDGVGLGLSLAREIARGHNGELSLDVTKEGWNTFLLTLPAIPRPDDDPLAAT